MASMTIGGVWAGVAGALRGGLLAVASSPWIQPAVGRLRQADRALAARLLVEFEARRALRADAPAAQADAASPPERVEAPPRVGRALAVDLAGLQHRLEAAGGLTLEHHWATWCESCTEELPGLAAAALRLAPGARSVFVSWDRLDDPRPLDDTLSAIEQFLHAHRLDLDVLVYTGELDALVAARRLTVPQIPQTRLLDVDGGVLRAWVGPMDAGDVAALTGLVQDLTSRVTAAHKPPRRRNERAPRRLKEPS
jgi:hypothetical protein